MKTLRLLLFLFVAMPVLAQPIQRQFGTTNNAPTLTNIIQSLATASLTAGVLTNNGLIYDDDFGKYKDFCNLSLLGVASSLGDASVLAAGTMLTDNANGDGIVFAEAYLNYYGVQTVYGQNTNSAGTSGITYNNDSTIFGTYLTKPSNATNVVLVYRNALSKAKNLATLVFTGPLDDLADLISSSADNYSTLSGSALISNKVSKIVIMGGDYPFSNPIEGNLASTRSDALLCLTNIPGVPVYWIGNTFGGSIKTFASYWTNQMDIKSPGYTYFNAYGANASIQSWDAVALFFAIYGTNYLGSNYFSLYRGSNSIAANASNTWVFGSGNQYFLSNACPVSTISNTINSLIVTTPKLSARFTSFQNRTFNSLTVSNVHFISSGSTHPMLKDAGGGVNLNLRAGDDSVYFGMDAGALRSFRANESTPRVIITPTSGANQGLNFASEKAIVWSDTSGDATASGGTLIGMPSSGLVRIITNVLTGSLTATNTITATNGLIVTSNNYPITALSGGWTALGNVGYVPWLSNNVVYHIWTNSLGSTKAGTNLIESF